MPDHHRDTFADTPGVTGRKRSSRSTTMDPSRGRTTMMPSPCGSPGNFSLLQKGSCRFWTRKIEGSSGAPEAALDQSPRESGPLGFQEFEPGHRVHSGDSVEG